MKENGLEQGPKSPGEDSLLYRLLMRSHAKRKDEEPNVPEPPEEQELPVAGEELSAPQEDNVPPAQEAQTAAPTPAAAPAPAPVAEEPTPAPEVPAPAPEAELAPQEEPGPPPEASQDARAELELGEGKMTATLIVRPPKGEGAPVSEELILSALAQKGITTGLRMPVIQLIAKRSFYDKSFVIAQGTPPQNGVNGRVEDLFARVQQYCPVEDAHGNVNFKDLGTVRNIHQGEPICNIIAPVPPVEGINVCGDPVRGTPGREAAVPRGQGTVLSPDGTQLVAGCSGNLRFSNGCFMVDEVLHIHGSVDVSVGNLDFCGDIVISGVVCEGFEVRSGKNVTVHDIVEGASIYAKGNITLVKGMNGMGKGTLEAKGDIKSRFLENCSVKAGGTIVAESIMNSFVYSEDKIVVAGRYGVLVGGSFTARNAIEAKKVGAASHIATTVVLGASPELVSERREWMQKLSAAQQAVESTTKDIGFLETKFRGTKMPPEYEELLAQRRKQKMVALIEQSRATKKAEELNAAIESIKTCSLTCENIYPPVRIMMGNSALTIRVQESNCRFYFEDGEIHRGSRV